MSCQEVRLLSVGFHMINKIFPIIRAKVIFAFIIGKQQKSDRQQCVLLRTKVGSEGMRGRPDWWQIVWFERP